jgi:Zn finger protein HypA/HybF involved in hydrogenase expression
MDLYDSVETECTITCSKCGMQSDLYGIDDFDAVDIYFEEGWRATKTGNVYCPNCASKNLKPQKIKQQ